MRLGTRQYFSGYTTLLSWLGNIGINNLLMEIFPTKKVTGGSNSVHVTYRFISCVSFLKSFQNLRSSIISYLNKLVKTI
jgi:hypothetical protein